jgi:glyoxylase-like metal-dependent hydrolase (beta-lactamase superfamily II)
MTLQNISIFFAYGKFFKKIAWRFFTMIDISLIKFGSLSIEFGESPREDLYEIGKDLGKLGDSSVIHIKYADRHYLVDTGFANESDLTRKNLASNELELKYRLSLQSLNFEDIFGIFITHWHADHFANLRLFQNAKIYCFNPENENYTSLARRFGFEKLLPIISLNSKDEFAGCQLFPTPGHTRLHCSLLVTLRNFKIVIAGDAIVSQSYYDHGEVWPYNAGQLSEVESKKAMNRIIKVADYIIPGHGHPFQNYRRNNSKL